MESDIILRHNIDKILGTKILQSCIESLYIEKTMLN